MIRDGIWYYLTFNSFYCFIYINSVKSTMYCVICVMISESFLEWIFFLSIYLLNLIYF